MSSVRVELLLIEPSVLVDCVRRHMQTSNDATYRRVSFLNFTARISWHQAQRMGWTDTISDDRQGWVVVRSKRI